MTTSHFSRPICRCLLLVLLTNLLGLGETYQSFGQRISFYATKITCNSDTGLLNEAVVNASQAALDSLSRRYGIPLATTARLKTPYVFTITSRIVLNNELVEQLESFNKFKYLNTVVLTDMKGKQEIMRVDNYPKNLMTLSQNQVALTSYFREIYDNIFNLFAGYGQKTSFKLPVTAAVKLIFTTSTMSIKQEQIKRVVQEVFTQNQASLGYILLEPYARETVSPLYIIKVNILENNRDTTATITLTFDANANLNYNGAPIQTLFQVETSDMKQEEFSYLLAKITATLYKFSKSNM